MAAGPKGRVLTDVVAPRLHRQVGRPAARRDAAAELGGGAEVSAILGLRRQFGQHRHPEGAPHKPSRLDQQLLRWDPLEEADATTSRLGGGGASVGEWRGVPTAWPSGAEVQPWVQQMPHVQTQRE